MPDEQTPDPTPGETLLRSSPRMNFERSGGRQSMVMLIWNNLYANCLHFLVVLNRLSRELSFFRITSHQRNSILDRLFNRKFGDQYSLLRNSLTEQLKPIDIARNEIVHWNTEVLIGSATDFEVVLRPPNFWDMNEDTPQKTKSDLIKFIEKCSFYSRLCNIFYMTMDTSLPMPEGDKKRWLEIFAQRIIYPPPPTHPLIAETGNAPS